MGKPVIQLYHQSIYRISLQADFHPFAFAPPRIVEHGTYRKRLADLLVFPVDPEKSDLGTQAVIEERMLASHFIIPTALRPERAVLFPFEGGVEATGLISFRYSGVDNPGRGKHILQGKFRCNLAEFKFAVKGIQLLTLLLRIFEAKIIGRSTFVIITYADRCGKAVDQQVIEGRLMIKGYSVGGRVVQLTRTVGSRQIIHYHRIIYSLPETEGAEQPFIPPVCRRFYIKLFRKHLLFLILPGKINTCRRKVLIDTLMIRQVLESRFAAETVSRTFIFHRQAGGRHGPFIKTVIVVVDIARPVCHRIADGIWITSLSGIVIRTHQAERQPFRRLPFQPDTSGAAFQVIRFLVGKQIGKISVIPVIIGGKGVAELLPYFRIAGKGILAGTVGTVRDRSIRSLKFQGGFGIDIDDSPHRIASV